MAKKKKIEKISLTQITRKNSGKNSDDYDRSDYRDLVHLFFFLGNQFFERNKVLQSLKTN